MKSDELMSRLRSLDVRMWAEDGQLRYSAPKGVVTDDLLADIRTNKQELLALLGNIGRYRRASALRRIERSGPLELSFAQERLWFLEQLFSDSGAYNSGLIMRLVGNLDRQALSILPTYALCNAIGKRFATQMLHHNHRQTIFFVDRKHCADIGMIQTSRDTRFGQQSIT